MLLVDFLSWLNASFYDGLPYAIVTLSFVLTFKYIRFPDVTCAGSFVLGAAVAAATTVYLNVHPVLALVLACAAGALGGALTAVFHILLRIDRLLAGILSAFILYAVNLMILRPTLPYGNAPTVLSAATELDRAIVFGGIAWHPYAILLFAGVVIAVKFLLDRILASEFGLALRALEDEDAGPAVLRSLDLSPSRFQTFALTVGNALVALSGALVSMKEGAANVHRGFDVLITGLIAFLLGVQLREWLPSLSEKLAMSRALQPLRIIGGLRRLRFTTLAASGSVIYFGIVAFSHRTSIPPELTKLVLALFVAVTVGDYASLRTQISLARNRIWGGDTMSPHGKSVPSTTRDSVLLACELTYTYPGNTKPALERVSINLQRGEMANLEGENGTGKTTLLKLINGEIDAPDSGTIRVGGVDLTFSPRDRRQRTVYLAQDARKAVVATLTVAENLALSSAGSRRSVLRQAVSQGLRDRINRSLQQYGFHNPVTHQIAASLSGGQRQLVNILRLILAPSLPAILLLDEPFNNLDSTNVVKCLDAIRTLRSRGVAIILVNHSVPVDLNFDRRYHLGDFFSPTPYMQLARKTEHGPPA